MLPFDFRLLSRLLSRADRDTSPGTAPPDTESAELSYLADYGELPHGPRWCCEPVHLRSDMSQARLFDASHFALEYEEADALVAAFNEHFAPQGLQLEFRHPGRWYLSGLPPVEPAPPSPRRLDGRSLHAFMPSQVELKALLNETQMLFHAHEVNRRRERRGEMTVNGVWLYGAGAPPEPRTPAWDAVYSNAAAYRGLARYCGLTQSELPEQPDIDALAGQGRALVHDERLLSAAVEGLGPWTEALAALERDWLAPLVSAVHGGRLKTVIIDPGRGPRYRLHRGALRRFWRRRRPLAHWIGWIA